MLFRSNSSDLTYGVFAGVGLGYTKYKVKVESEKHSKSQFDPTLNLGFRALAMQHHGLEIGMKIPFRKAKIDAPDPDDGAGVLKVKRNPRFDLIYTYNF